VIAEIAQRGGIAFAAGEEVLVDTQHRGTARRMPLFELALESPPEVALHGRGAEVFPPAQAAAVDAVQVLLIDGLLKRLAGTLTAQNSGQRLAGLASTTQALGLGAWTAGTQCRSPQSWWRTVR
jgi:hypothetical protein